MNINTFKLPYLVCFTCLAYLFTFGPSAIAAESPADRARRVIETSDLIRQAMDKAAQKPEGPEEQKLAADIAFQKQIYQLVAADIANDGVNLAQRTILMPWEITTRELLSVRPGHSPFHRPVPSGARGLGTGIGNEQLAGVQQLIEQGNRRLTILQMQRAWSRFSAVEREQCEKYQPEFAAEASGRNAAELERLAKEIAASPADAKLRWARGQIAALRGDSQMAAQDLAACLALHPENEDQVRLLRAQIAEEQGDLKTAEEDYRTVGKGEGPLATDAYVSLGHLCLRSRRFADALWAVVPAFKIDPNCAEANALAAEVFTQVGRTTQAIEAITDATESAPDDPRHFYRLATIQAENGNDDAAADAYSRAIALDPIWWRPRAGKSNLLMQQGKTEEALAEITVAAEWAPREPSVHRDRAAVLRALGRSQEAQQEQRLADQLQSAKRP